MTTLERWSRLWSQLGVAHPNTELFHQIIERYSEPHRHYHTLKHLDECFQHLDSAKQLASHPAEIELALWFHDAIYEVQKHNNEELSANWAHASSLANGLATESCDRIFDFVQITGSHSLPKTSDEALLIDIDLTILGAAPDRFDEYEQAIRAEYSWVPSLVFNVKRRSILQKFLDRKSIFNTQHFVEHYEQQARINLQRSLA
jgi:predicted metal-dependent HD superfamily phosphohydrolase